MKILLTHGYYLYEDEKEQAIMRPYPPLGILYISGYLEQKGIEHELYDTTFSSKESFQNYLLKERPDFIALYTNLMTKLNILELIQFVRNTPELKGATIVQGGPDVTYNIENYLNCGTDVIVIGEGEHTLYELVKAGAANRSSWQSIPGIAYKEGNSIIKTAEREKMKDIDLLPFPNRKKIDLHQYLDVWKKHHGKSALSVSTQRGCPYTCRWCSTAVYGQSYRRRSPEKVVDELEWLQKTYDPDSIWFVDDVFTVSHKWLEAFRDELISRGISIPFECISRADRMTEEVIQMLKQAGCFRIWIGAESGSQKIIDAMDRRVDVEKVQEMIRLSRQYGIEAGTFIMLGYPGETEKDIQKTIEHLKSANPDWFTITIAYPIKGTGLYEEVEAKQINTPRWEESTDRDRDFERTYSKKYYQYAVKHVVNEVNFHKKRIENQHISLTGAQYFLKSKLAKTVMNWERFVN